MKRITGRRVAGVIMCTAVVIWMSAIQGSVVAKSCQEYCDSDYSACQAACIDTCGGYNNTCLEPCDSDCYSQYYSCSYGATTCYVQVISVCDVTWFWIWNPQQAKQWQATVCTTYMR